MRHGLDLISRKSVRRWSPKKKWNSRHIYLGKTCKAFDMRWLNIVSFKKAKNTVSFTLCSPYTGLRVVED